ncbi:MAG: hypothetical protein CMB13_01960 [Euryarchaeota archaeon]|nr:hypothetical protein [Euryarchaeota archaeon]
MVFRSNAISTVVLPSTVSVLLPPLNVVIDDEVALTVEMSGLKDNPSIKKTRKNPARRDAVGSTERGFIDSRSPLALIRNRRKIGLESQLKQRERLSQV